MRSTPFDLRCVNVQHKLKHLACTMLMWIMPLPVSAGSSRDFIPPLRQADKDIRFLRFHSRADLNECIIFVNLVNANDNNMYVWGNRHRFTHLLSRRAPLHRTVLGLRVVLVFVVLLRLLRRLNVLFFAFLSIVRMSQCATFALSFAEIFLGHLDVVELLELR